MKLTLNELEKIVPLLDKRVNELLTIHKKMIVQILPRLKVLKVLLKRWICLEQSNKNWRMQSDEFFR